MDTHKDLDTVVKDYSRRAPEWLNEGHNEGSRSLVLTGDQYATLLRSEYGISRFMDSDNYNVYLVKESCEKITIPSLLKDMRVTKTFAVFLIASLVMFVASFPLSSALLIGSSMIAGVCGLVACGVNPDRIPGENQRSPSLTRRYRVSGHKVGKILKITPGDVHTREFSIFDGYTTVKALNERAAQCIHDAINDPLCSLVVSSLVATAAEYNADVDYVHGDPTRLQIEHDILTIANRIAYDKEYAEFLRKKEKWEIAKRNAESRLEVNKIIYNSIPQG